jgi:hypothetical protein
VVTTFPSLSSVARLIAQSKTSLPTIASSGIRGLYLTTQVRLRLSLLLRNRAAPYNERRALRDTDYSLPKTMTKPAENILELPLEQWAEMALKAAVERIIVDHARQGLPIYFWRDGKVVKLLPEELRAESARLQTE